jgi:hypothetical protein
MRRKCTVKKCCAARSGQVMNTPAIVIDDHSIPNDAAVTLKMEGATLGAALQAIEDQNRVLRFVVRDYGLFLTDRVYAAEEGFLPLAEFVKARAGDTAPAAETNQRLSPPVASEVS